MKCGCKIVKAINDEGIMFCPLHAAAEEMLAFIKKAGFYSKEDLLEAMKIVTKAREGRHE